MTENFGIKIPFYQDDLATLYYGDCINIAKWIEPESIDLVVTSPPFNANMEYEIGMWQTLDDYLSWLCDRFIGLFPICASGAWVVCELQDLHVSPEHSHAHPRQKEQFNMATSAYLTRSMIESGFYFKGEIIWDRGRWINNMAGRMACAPGSPAILCQHSKVLFFRKRGGRKGVYQFPEQSKEWRSRWCRSVWSHIHPKHNPRHPAVMPYAMAFGIIEGWSLPDSTILDPFAGSGTTLRAAKDMGRKSVGVEVFEKYCIPASNNLMQQSLFSSNSVVTRPSRLEQGDCNVTGGTGATDG